ncbi:MAG: hypothetical protein ACOYOU_06750 [Kiritimatiellia bacterium]
MTSKTGPRMVFAPPEEHPLPGARTALLLLLGINLFNFIDRQVLAAVVPDIRRVFLTHEATGAGPLFATMN